MNRRAVLLALVASAWPMDARPQTRPVIGFMSGRWPDESSLLLAAFHRGLGETGYVEGMHVTVELRWAEGHYERLPAIAAELVGRRVDVIAAVGGGVSGLAAKAATSTTPIVFASGGDAVKIGLVPSLSRPGGNVTGVNLVFGALGPKRLELLHQVIPAARSIAVLVNPVYPSAAEEIALVQAAALRLGLEVQVAEAAVATALPPAFERLAAGGVGGLLVADDPFLQGLRQQIVLLAERHAMPAIYFSREFATAGGLMSYGGSMEDGYRLVGTYVGRILAGARPAELPVLQPTKFEFVVNLKTATALGLAFPTSLLARADELIE